MPTISVNEIKRIKSLASKKFRDMYGEFTVEGEKMVAEAVSSSFAVEKIWRRDEIGEEAMSRISQLSSPSPVLAVVRKPANVSLDTGMQIREACKKDQLLANVCEFIFIVPPSLQILEARLRGRATDSEEQLALRIGKAKHELSFANLYDYIIVNDNLELAAEEMLSLISSFKLSTKRRQWEE